MQNELRKLAQILREADRKRRARKTVKCAQAAQALTGLELLRRKIGR